MNFLRIIWDYEADGNVEHVDEHDLTPADVEFVLHLRRATSSSLNWSAISGRFLTTT